jgi:hypothetical protein
MECNIRISRTRLFFVVFTVLAMAQVADAGVLTNTEIDVADWSSIAGTAVSSALVSTFDFSPATTGGDGQVVSQVFDGIGDLDGFIIFAYQATLFSGSSSTDLTKLSFKIPFSTLDTDLLDFDGDGADDTSFWINGSIGGAFVGGSIAPEIAVFQPVNQNSSWGDSGDLLWLGKGQVSRVFGYAVPEALGFQIIGANVLDTTITVKDPQVYTPNPEPGSMLVWLGATVCCGLAGLRKRRRANTGGAQD